MEAPKRISLLTGLQNVIEPVWQKWFDKVATVDGDNDFTGTTTFSGPIAGLPFAIVSNTSSQLIATHSYVKKTFSVVDYDPDSLWDAGNNRFVIPKNALIEVKAANGWAGGIAPIISIIDIRVSSARVPGGGYVESQNTTTNYAGTSISTATWPVSANDPIDVYVRQDSGSSYNTNPNNFISWFSVRVIRWL